MRDSCDFDVGLDSKVRSRSKWHLQVRRSLGNLKRYRNNCNCAGALHGATTVDLCDYMYALVCVVNHIWIGGKIKEDKMRGQDRFLISASHER